MISVDPAPSAGVDDAGNQWDSDATVAEVFAHNARLEAACKEGS